MLDTMHECADCGRKFTTARGLGVHRVKAHRAKPAGPFNCELCGRTDFKSAQGLSLHITNHKKNKPNVHLNQKDQQLLHQRRHYKTDKAKRTAKAYRSSAAGKLVMKRGKAKYRKSEHGKAQERAHRKAYVKTDHAIALRRIRENTSEAKEKSAQKGVKRSMAKLSFLNRMWHTTKSSAFRRKLEFDLTRDFFVRQAEQQHNLCHYSGQSMAFSSLSTWQASVERIDPLKGYMAGNVVLICLEFNTTVQWSRTMVQDVFGKEHSPVHEDVLRDSITAVSSIPAGCYGGPRGPLLEVRIQNGVQEKRCRKCSEWFKGRECNPCLRSHLQASINTPSGRLKALLSSSRTSAKLRLSRGRVDAGEHKLTFQDMVDMYRKQRGACFYSSIPLAFEGSMRVSLERLDVDKGYTVENCVLICYAFQTSDHSCRGRQNRHRDSDEVASAGWTRDKFAHICTVVRRVN